MPLRVNTINSYTAGNSVVITANVSLPANGEFRIPSGTLAERPTSNSNGMLRFNTSSNWLELNLGNTWYKLTTT